MRRTGGAQAPPRRIAPRCFRLATAPPTAYVLRHRHLAGRLGRFALLPSGRLGARSDYPPKDRLTLSGRMVAVARTCTRTVKGPPMETGTVKWFNETKGYGFIQPDNGGKDVFVHISAVERSGIRGLREGQKVSFELQTDQRNGKTSAVNLQAA